MSDLNTRAERLVQLLGVDPEDIFYDVQRDIALDGLEEGYPECCIAFFINTWFPLVDLIFPDVESEMPEFDELNADQQLAAEIWLKHLNWCNTGSKSDRILCHACALKKAKVHQNSKRVAPP